MSWWYIAVAVTLGGVAAAWLRTDWHRHLDDETFFAVPPACIPVVAGLAVLPAVVRVSVSPPAVVISTYVLAVVWALTVVAADLEVGRVPDLLTLPAYPVAAVLLTVCSVATHDYAALPRAAACAGISTAAFLLSQVCLGDAGPGLGDVKLSGVLGAVLGWISWSASLGALALTVVLCSGVIGAVLLALVLRRAPGRRRLVVVTPALVLSGFITGLCVVLGAL